MEQFVIISNKSFRELYKVKHGIITCGSLPISTVGKSTMAALKAGNFRNCKKDTNDVSFADFSDPFFFYNLMIKSLEFLYSGCNEMDYYVTMHFANAVTLLCLWLHKKPLSMAMLLDIKGT